MNLNDGDFELIFGLYDAAFELIPEKEKSQFADDVVQVIVSNEVDLTQYSKEVSDHCEYLSEAVDSHFEQEEEEAGEDFEDFNEDDYEDWE